MGISSTTNRQTYTGDGSSTIFAFPYYFTQSTDLLVYFQDTVAGTITPQVLNTNYTISGTQTNGIFLSGGNVVLNSAATSTTLISITRSPNFAQLYSLLQNQTISSQPLVNEFDYLTLLTQRLQDEAGTRSAKLADGFGATFDATLPPNMNLVPGAAVLINSGGTGFVLGLVLTASSAVAGFAGVLPIANGGTGTNAVPTTGQILYAATPAAFGYIGGPAGYVLTSNGSSAPSYQLITVGSSPVAATDITGTLGTYQGGTGTGSGYIFTQFSLLFASSATQFTSLSVGGTDQPLMGVTGGPPAFKQLNLASNSSVTGVLATANGGTGTAILTQFGIIVASTATQMSTVLPGASGTVLTSNGASALPSYQSAAIVPLPLTTKSATYNAATTDSVILVSSSGFAINLYGTSGNTGKQVTVIRTDAAIGNVTVVGSSANIQGSAVILASQWESVSLICDGTNWQIPSLKKGTTKTVITALGAGTYTVPAEAIAIKVIVTGGGGGGGGCASGAGVTGAAGGGASGGTAIKFITNLSATYAYTIGAGGPGGSAGANAGIAGSSSTFVASVTVTGNSGNGGSGTTGSVTFPFFGGAGLAGAGTASNGDINLNGGTGGPGICLALAQSLSGYGGTSFWGPSANPVFQATGSGIPGVNYGTGGTGGATQNNGGTVAGGAGAQGIIVIEEYYG